MNDIARMARGTIVVGFDGMTLDAERAHFFADAGFAGYVMFARNIGSLERVRALTDRLRTLHDIPPLLAIDQEGGRVARLRDGVEAIPAMMALGATRNEKLAYMAGERLAFDLRRAGFTMNFAPVLDLAIDPRNTVIGSRACGADPVLVCDLASALARGMERGGIVATYKHFPGHGSTAVDSHAALPVIDLDEATFRARDLVPFASVLPQARAVMSAHIVVRAFDDAHPATLSSRLLSALLREELRFRGVCFTDCLQMDAIAKGIGTLDAVAAAIAAGADCALVSHDPHLALRAAERLADAVAAGRIPYERLHEAHARVTALRRESSPPLALDASPVHRGIGRAIGREAVTLLRGVAHADPTASVVVSFEGASTEGALGVHETHARLRDQAPALEEIIVPLDPRDDEVRAALHTLEACQRRPIVLMRRAHRYPAQGAAVRAIVARMPDALVISTREPFDLAQARDARHLIACYDDGEASFGGLADVIFGSGAAAGQLPVDIPCA